MRKLTEFERHVIEDKGTERPFSGEYNQHDAPGVYHCKRCDAPLYLSEHKFNAHCGWPAFDDEIPGAVTRVPDADGHRTEIVCHQCGGHLGHLFEGEYLTDKNLRHCVNSVSMVFKGESRSQAADSHIQWATLAGGCFWCLEAIFAQLRGVISVKSGYAGGDATTANYREVCGGDTGHAEVVQIEFDSHIISFEELLEVFWQSHDPTTLNRQGNDVGTQYRSAIFAHNDVQIKIATQMIKQLADANVFDKPIVTELVALDTFYPAESYHDAYFEHNSEQPYCQMVVKPKVEKVKVLFKQRLKSGTAGTV